MAKKLVGDYSDHMVSEPDTGCTIIRWAPPKPQPRIIPPKKVISPALIRARKLLTEQKKREKTLSMLSAGEPTHTSGITR